MKQGRFDITEVVLITSIVVVAVFTVVSVLIYNGKGESSENSIETTKEQYSEEIEEEYTYDYSEIIGTYMDEYSQRAGMTVELDSDRKTVAITVRWSSSASEYSQWTMNAVMKEDGMLVYDNCTKSDFEYLADGSEIENKIYSNGNGYFMLMSDGRLSWEGADEDNCRNCIFVKTE